MSWKSAPYATMRDAPTYQERAKETIPPWDKDQTSPVNAKGQRIYTASQIAPYGNTYNQPAPRRLSASEKTLRPPYATVAVDRQQPERSSNGASNASQPAEMPIYAESVAAPSSS